MVIHIEYRDQRYSMGSSDPLPAGFEIRFGSLNFQATRNGYLMRITNRDKLHARRQAGSAPVPVAPVVATPTPASTDAAGPSAPLTLRPVLTTGADRAPSRCVRRLATRRAHRRDDGRSDGGTLGLGAAIPPRSARRYDSVRRLRQHRRGDTQGSPWPPCSDRQGPQRFRRRQVVSRLRRRAATRHFARVRGVGLC
jgi:hypothetical protein